MKKEKLFYLILTIATILIMVGSVAYAYFTTKVNELNEEVKNTNARTKVFVEATFDYGNNIGSSSALPGYKDVKEMKLVSSCPGDDCESIVGTISVEEEIPEVFGSDIEWAIYEVEENNRWSATNGAFCTYIEHTDGEFFTESSCPETTGLTPIVSSSDEIKSIDIPINGNKTTYYYLVLTYKNDDAVDVNGEAIQNLQQGETFSVSIHFSQGETHAYKDRSLNGTDPVLGSGMIPVMISDNGTITYASENDEWYDYENSVWANAVILNSTGVAQNYSIEEGHNIISLDHIESMFVWIPKYSYQIQTLGNSAKGSESEFQIKFGNFDTLDNNKILENGIEKDVDYATCAYPDVSTNSGNNGNCQVGDYVTHPAFPAFNTKGIWVGKFETTGTLSAITIKPGLNSLTNETLKDMWNGALNYKSTLFSHMIKSTEWGAVAYLYHSQYGRCNNGVCEEINMNNCRTGTSSSIKFTTGIGSNGPDTSVSADTCTAAVNQWNGNIGKTASTTGNISGIYDMSGGTIENVSANCNKKTGDNVPSVTDFTNYPNYFDVYTVNGLTGGILGDATRETRNWYNDAITIPSSWAYRGSTVADGKSAGIFYIGGTSGGKGASYGFRMVLVPTE